VLVALKTAVAMMVEASWQIDGDKRIADRLVVQKKVARKPKPRPI
jgi:hypothetical protein